MKYLEIKKDDLVFNVKTLAAAVAPSKIIAVLKGNAYGLDSLMFGKILLENGIDTFAVSELDEAVLLREAGFSNEIILLTPASCFDEAKAVCDNKITATVSSLDEAELLNGFGLKINAHIKIDTGFSRYGFYNNELCEKLSEFENINYTGVFSHFSNSFCKDGKYSKRQFERFMQAVQILKSFGIDPEIKHICNSCGAIGYEYARLDAVRIGSAFLGRLPIENGMGLRKIARLVSEVKVVRNLPKGVFVGYANTYITKKDTKAAVVPVGYKDGYGVEKSKDIFRFTDILRYVYSDLKSFRKKIYVEINGKNYPVIGRISMHNIVVDITGADVKQGDKVYLECNPILLKSEIKRIYI